MKGLNLKIAATVAAVNALMAAAIIGAAPAKAQSCGQTAGCVASQACANPNIIAALCQINAPPGCSYVSSQCVAQSACQPGGSTVPYRCNWQ